MAQQNTEPTYLLDGEITGQQALAQARESQLETRRRWPAVRSAVTSLQALRADCATPPPAQPKARTA